MLESLYLNCFVWRMLYVMYTGSRFKGSGRQLMVVKLRLQFYLEVCYGSFHETYQTILRCVFVQQNLKFSFWRDDFENRFTKIFKNDEEKCNKVSTVN